MGVPARAPVVSSRFRFVLYLTLSLDAAKTRFYSNLNRFIKKQSRFAPDVHDFSGGFTSSIWAKGLFPRGFPVGFQSLYDWA
jgi:hypothetical protein